MVRAAWATEARLEGGGFPLFYILDDELLALRFSPAWVSEFSGRAVLEAGEEAQLEAGKSYLGVLFTAKDVPQALYLNATGYRSPDTSFPSLRALTYVLGKGGFGLRTSLGLWRFENDSEDVSQSEYLLSLEPGVKLGQVDGFLTLEWASFTQKAGTTMTYTASSPLHKMGLAIRWFKGESPTLTLGAWGWREDWGTKLENPDTAITRDSSETRLLAWAGFNLRPSDASLVIAGLYLDYTRTDWSDSLWFAVADYRAYLGAEHWATEALGFRGGVDASFLYSDAAGYSLGSGPVAVFLGTSLRFGGLQLDATLSEDLLYRGPYLLTGNASELVGRLALLYNFGS